MKIIPGILEQSFEEIQSRVEEVVQQVKRVQVDICDGAFVQSKTWPYSHMTTGRIEENFHINRLQSEEIGLPSWDKVEYQFDLMIKNPWHTMPVWAKVGATSVVIHPTSCESIEKVKEAIRIADEYMMEVYLAYTYDEWNTAKETLTDVLTEPAVKGIQCMTIERIGVQGQSFDVRWVHEFSYIKTNFPNLQLQLDGGISERNEREIQESGADSLVIGSAIFEEGNPTENSMFYKKIFA